MRYIDPVGFDYTDTISSRITTATTASRLGSVSNNHNSNNTRYYLTVAVTC
jgi:hypothetical protein